MKGIRIKLDLSSQGLSSVQWLFCDLVQLKTISDLRLHLCKKYDLKKPELILDDALLPDEEPIQILTDGDLIKVNLGKKSKKKRKREEPPSSSSSSSSEDEKPLKKTMKLEVSVANPQQETAKKVDVKEVIKKRSSSEPSSSSSEDEVDNGEKTFKKTMKLEVSVANVANVAVDDQPQEAEKKVEVKVIENTAEEDEQKKKRKRKRTKKNKNKNKLDVSKDQVTTPITPVAKPFVPRIVKSQTAKHIKFTDDEQATNADELQDLINSQTEVIKAANKKLEASSPIINCEDMLLSQLPDKGFTIYNPPKAKEFTKKLNVQTGSNGSNESSKHYKSVEKEELTTNIESTTETNNSGFSSIQDALLNLAKNKKPIIVSRKQQRDVYTNKSVILTNGSTTTTTTTTITTPVVKKNEYANLEQYPLHQCTTEPKVGQTFAFKSVQIGPDYTPNLTQFVGEIKTFDNDQVNILILFDENEGKERLDKFEVDPFFDSTTLLRNQAVDFKWSTLCDIRFISTKIGT
jgi:hypothetical protein